MKEIEVMHAQKAHKDFIIKANRVINNVNETEQTPG